MELLYIAQCLGIPIAEKAVNWQEIDGKKLFIFSSFQIYAELIRLCKYFAIICSLCGIFVVMERTYFADLFSQILFCFEYIDRIFCPDMFTVHLSRYRLRHLVKSCYFRSYADAPLRVLINLVNINSRFLWERTVSSEAII